MVVGPLGVLVLPLPSLIGINVCSRRGLVVVDMTLLVSAGARASRLAGLALVCAAFKKIGK